MKEAGISINQNNPALTQVLELAGKDIKKVVISVFHIFKKLRHGKYNKDPNIKMYAVENYNIWVEKYSGWY